MKKSLNYITVVCCCCFLSACIGTFKYKVPKDAPIAEHQYNCTIDVENFQDKRPRIGSNKMFFFWIPLLPYGWGYYNRPEDGTMYLGINGFDFEPNFQLRQAAEMSLKHSKLFQNDYFLNPYIEEKPDYIFTGIINSTLYRQKVFSYCLSVDGPLLWFIGAPMGWTENQLDIDFILKSTKDNKTVWSYNAKNSEDSVHWFYYQGQDVKDYVPVMQKCMNEAIINLENFIKNHPEKFDVN